MKNTLCFIFSLIAMLKLENCLSFLQKNDYYLSDIFNIICILSICFISFIIYKEISINLNCSNKNYLKF